MPIHGESNDPPYLEWTSTIWARNSCDSSLDFKKSTVRTQRHLKMTQKLQYNQKLSSLKYDCYILVERFSFLGNYCLYFGVIVSVFGRYFGISLFHLIIRIYGIKNINIDYVRLIFWELLLPIFLVPRMHLVYVFWHCCNFGIRFWPLSQSFSLYTAW